MIQTAFFTALAVFYAAYSFLFFEYPVPTLTAAIGIILIAAYEIRHKDHEGE